MVHPYLRRRDGTEVKEKQPKEISQVLDRTLGVPIFQEQVIQLVMVAAGFSAGEADALRRAMATWKTGRGLSHFHEKIVNGMRSRGYSLEFAERLCHQIEGFGKYGFPESHAASFALLVYLSAWIKCHMPAAFYWFLYTITTTSRRTPPQYRNSSDQCKHFGMALDPRRCGGIPMYSTGTSPHQGFQN